MRRPLGLIWMILCLSCGVIGFAGCGGGDSPETTEPPPSTDLTEEESQEAEEIAETWSALFQAGNLVTGLVRQQGGAPGEVPLAAPAEPTTCPTVQVGTLQPGLLQLEVDYGTGCTMANGVEASGKMTITWRATIALPDTIAVAFEAFSLEGYGLTGVLAAVGEQASWVYSYAGSIASGGEVWTVDATFGVAMDNHQTPQDPTDDTSTITGGGSFASGGSTYEVDIVQALHLVYDCVYPTQGTLTYQEDSDTPIPDPVHTIDFGAGDCCTVHVSVGDRGEDLNLCAS